MRDILGYACEHEGPQEDSDRLRGGWGIDWGTWAYWVERNR